MKFISNGDFIFPFEASFYWIKHFFIWSFQTGALNLDGIIRIPGRLLEAIVFQLFGHMFASYFYLFFCFALIFIAFYIFCRHFLQIHSRLISVIAALVVTCNPVFLGNTSKIGLVLAASLLPLCLVCIKLAFEKRQPVYIIGLIIALNISFLHPFNMAVNVFVSLGYVIYMSFRHWSFVKRHALHLVAIVGLAVAMHAYMLLPIAQLGTIDKAAITQEVSETPIDYTALVEVANTGDLLTSFSLSKDVFKDYDFYNNQYQPIYFIATLGFYVLLISLFFYLEKRLSRREKLGFVLCSFASLSLLLVATGTVFQVDELLKYLIEKPGGWTFRSPLKWQLYTPFFLFTALFLLIRRLDGSARRIALTAIVVLSLGASGFLVTQVYQRLLVPRTVHTFQPLLHLQLDNKRVLYVTNEDCSAFAGENPTLFTELNQVFISKNVQLKQVSARLLSTMHLASYDYVLSCQQSADEFLAKSGQFSKQLSFVADGISLFKNKQPLPHVFAVADLFQLESATAITEKQQAAARLQKTFNFAHSEDTAQLSAQAHTFMNPFETVTAANIQRHQLTATVPMRAGQTAIVLQTQQKPLYWRDTGTAFELSTVAGAGRQKLSAQSSKTITRTSKSQPLQITYTDPAFNYRNLIANPSFEKGLWQNQVGDCNNFDQNPQLSMGNSTQASAGTHSLLLEAQRHTACTGPEKPITVEASKSYLFSFDYKADNNKAGYNFNFNTPTKDAYSEVVRPAKKEATHDDWHRFATVISAPETATVANLQLYGYPGSQGKNNQTYYDNVKLISIPNVRNMLSIMQIATTATRAPQQTRFTIVSPVESTVHITGATQPFYLAMNDSFHTGWQASLQQPHPFNMWDRSGVKDHFAMNGDSNGWYIEPEKICVSAVCQRQPDGSYNFTVHMTFAPQRALLVGLAVSGVAWGVAVLLLVRGMQRPAKKA